MLLFVEDAYGIELGDASKATIVVLLLETAATIFHGWRAADHAIAELSAPGSGGGDAFPGYEAAHNRRFVLVVVPGVLAATVGGRAGRRWHIAFRRPGHAWIFRLASELLVPLGRVSL